MIETLNLSAEIWALIIVIGVWEMIWKFMAMWRASKNNSVAWFIVLGILNTIGILPILYIYVFGKKKKISAGKPRKRKRR